MQPENRVAARASELQPLSADEALADQCERYGPAWPEETFAEEVARAQDGRAILFRVSPEVAARAEEWSGPVSFRFVPREDDTYEMELRRVD